MRTRGTRKTTLKQRLAFLDEYHQQEVIGLLSLAQQDVAILPSTDLNQDTEYPGELHKPAFFPSFRSKDD